MASNVSNADDEPGGSGAETPVEDGNQTLLDRRSYVKLAGAASMGAAMTGLASADEEYETITARNQTIRIGRGETYENKLIDVSNGNSVVLLVSGGNSTIRNIGFEGLHRGRGFMVSITASSGQVLFENIYLGDGSTKQGGGHVHGPGAFFYHRQANCDMVFRHCNVQGWPNNGFYCSNTAYGGSARFENCYGKNNGVSTFRIAGGRDRIENCVAYNDNTNYGPGWGGYVEDQGRPVWVWPGGTPTIVDSHFAAGGYPYAMVMRGGSRGRMRGGAIRGRVQRAGQLQRSSVGRSPDLSIPDGVPRSATEAAAGGPTSEPDDDDESTDDDEAADDVDDLEHLLVVDGDERATTRYEFTVSGEVRPSTHDGATIDPETEIDDGEVHGVVADWKDAFRFSGDLEQLTVDGPATVFLDGEAIDPDDYGVDLPHELTIEGQGSPTSVEITVDGTIEVHDETDPADQSVAISGSTVQSSVTDESHRFVFSGAITDVTYTEGEAVIMVDGEVIDPGEYGEYELLPHAIVFDASDADRPSTYSFQVSGRVVRSTYSDATIDDEDVIEDGSVDGTIEHCRDAYWFDGNVQGLRLAGDARVDIQYNAREQ